eukprot:gene45300-62846_t
MGKARAAGFADAEDTAQMWLSLFHSLSADAVIPPILTADAAPVRWPLPCCGDERKRPRDE